MVKIGAGNLFVDELISLVDDLAIDLSRFLFFLIISQDSC